MHSKHHTILWRRVIYRMRGIVQACMHALRRNSARHQFSIHFSTTWSVAKPKKNGKPYIVKEMSLEDFLDNEKLANEFTTNWKVDEDEKVRWTDIRGPSGQRSGVQKVFYKISYDAEFSSIDLHRVHTHHSRVLVDWSTISLSQLQLAGNFKLRIYCTESSAWIISGLVELQNGADA